MAMTFWRNRWRVHGVAEGMTRRDGRMPSPTGQTVVITGASAGVGRAAAMAFARRGWKVALLARSASGLSGAKQEIEARGGACMAIAADTADAAAILAAADQVVARWGQIDAWVNNAMVTMYAPAAEMTPAEFRRITEVTYLGYVHGTLAALAHMKPRNAGTIVQVGSALSYRAIPLQSAYCGAKFAVRGFTDALRSELLHDGSAVRLCMVQLPAVNTPQFDWGRNRTGRRVQPVPPIYQPEAVAERIVQAAEHPTRELWVGWPSVKAIVGTILAPGLLDRLLAKAGYDGQITGEPLPADARDNLFEAAADGHGSHGRFDAQAKRRVGAVNPAALRGLLAALLVAGAAALAYALAAG
jgi:short-subunit dehydrogenase